MLFEQLKSLFFEQFALLAAADELKRLQMLEEMSGENNVQDIPSQEDSNSCSAQAMPHSTDDDIASKASHRVSEWLRGAPLRIKLGRFLESARRFNIFHLFMVHMFGSNPYRQARWIMTEIKETCPWRYVIPGAVCGFGTYLAQIVKSRIVGNVFDAFAHAESASKLISQLSSDSTSTTGLHTDPDIDVESVSSTGSIGTPLFSLAQVFQFLYKHWAVGVVPLVFLLLVSFTEWIFSMGKDYFFARAKAQRVLVSRTRYLATMVRQELSWHTSHKSHDLSQRLERECTAMDNLIVNGLDNFLRGLVAVVIVFAMLWVDWQITVLSLVLRLPQILQITEKSVQVAASYERLKDASLSASQSTANEILSNIKSIHVYTAENQELTSYLQKLRVYTDITAASALSETLFRQSEKFVLLITEFVMLMFGGYRILTGGITIGTFSAYRDHVSQFIEMFHGMEAVYYDLRRASLLSNRYFMLKNRMPKIPSEIQPPSAKSILRWCESSKTTIREAKERAALTINEKSSQLNDQYLLVKCSSTPIKDSVLSQIRLDSLLPVNVQEALLHLLGNNGMRIVNSIDQKFKGTILDVMFPALKEFAKQKQAITITSSSELNEIQNPELEKVATNGTAPSKLVVSRPTPHIHKNDFLHASKVKMESVSTPVGFASPLPMEETISNQTLSTVEEIGSSGLTRSDSSTGKKSLVNRRRRDSLSSMALGTSPLATIDKAPHSGLYSTYLNQNKIVGDIVFHNVSFSYDTKSYDSSPRIDASVSTSAQSPGTSSGNDQTSGTISSLSGLQTSSEHSRFDPLQGLSVGKGLVLKNISLRIPQGKVTAIVGPSGSGKSTLLHLLLRLSDPVSGYITFDGKDIRNYPIHDLRRSITLVQQDSSFVNKSVLSNITYGLEMPHTDEIFHSRDSGTAPPDSSTDSHKDNNNESTDYSDENPVSVPYPDRGTLSRAIALSNCEFIFTHPAGLSAPVGERGGFLSGGQKQRLSVARAILREPSILLLDEATSALDSKSEYIVTTSIANLMKGRTCVVVAHRLATVQNADNIVVMDDGRIVEQGTHSALLQQGGLYASLVLHQTLHK